jgi:hypothetical protein
MSNKNKLWFKIENLIAEKLGLKRIGFSGGKWPNKEDVENDNIICQVKTTEGISISIHSTAINDLFERALIQHKVPLFAFHIDKVKYDSAKTWIAMPLEAFSDCGIIENNFKKKERKRSRK